MKLPVRIPTYENGELLPPDEFTLYVLVKKALKGGHSCRQYESEAALQEAFDETWKRLGSGPVEYQLEAYTLHCHAELIDGIKLVNARANNL